ncbi:MAG: MGMT family protein [Saprospiraceae bacterium]
MSGYFKDVYELVRLIPPGRISTYGIISDYLGLGSPRMVGWALNKHLESDVPAHRVVNRNGELTGKNHFSPPTIMQTMLEKEGIRVIDNKIVDFQKLLWFFE